MGLTIWLLRVCFFSSRRRHTRFDCDWSSDVCSSDLRLDLQAIHLPDIDLPIVVAPENVAVAVAVLRADALDMPIAGDRSVRDDAFRFNVQADHLPDVDLPAVVAPQNVALPIPVEVTE